MTASTPDPAAGVAPVRRRVSPQAGEPGPVARVTGPGGKSSPPALPPPPEGAPSSPQPSERQAAGIPDPATGAKVPRVPPAPVRVRAPRTPAGGVGAGKILPEDDSRHVTEVTCRIGEPYPLGRLVLHLTEVPAATGGEAA